MKELLGITTCECSNCKKQFDRLSQDWTYKIALGAGKYDYYCKYSCWVKGLEDRKDSIAKARSFRMSKDQKQKLFDMLDHGYPQEEIARILGVSKQLVQYYRKKRP